ncbi:glycine/D-amino acid oxidase, deaminating [Gloeocapsa sp. PCC 73106]|nr:glycine/D-amino acid oxidase, deaminating [Gloeocapsa sp. PCC 73106]
MNLTVPLRFDSNNKFFEKNCGCMNISPFVNHSFWIESTPSTNFPMLNGDLTVDVAIVGGGIAGLTAAYLLTQAGKTVAVIEAKQIVTGVSGHTTAKITSLHQLIYADLIKEFGAEKARIYADSNQAALEKVAEIVATEEIDCDFHRCSAYTFALPHNDLSKIKAEVTAAIQLGLPASFVTETSLPFATPGAIKFDNQAQFHIRKYLLHLANVIVSKNSYIFEQTRVQTVEEGDCCRVISEQGVISAEKVLITTHLPILDQGLFFAKTYPQRSYLMAATLEPSYQAPEGMFIGYGEDYYSIRTAPDGDEVLLIIGGQGHKVGAQTDTDECYRALEQYARQHFPIQEIKYRWSTQDLVSFDKLPYIGQLTPLSKHLYVATGFSLWGMTKGTLSAMILSDLILGKDNPWAHIYEATRANPFVTSKFLQQNLDVGKHWFGDRLKGLFTDSDMDLKPEEGKVIVESGKRMAIYRDAQGELHKISAVCTHLGCIVNWNSAEKSWDCPCHGARFSYEGKVICAPAVEDLKTYRDIPHGR